MAAPMLTPWGDLPPPIDPVDTQTMMRACSILFGWVECRDGDSHPVLPAWQAADVVAWNERSRWRL